jgi:ParB-like nuclease family protein
MAKYKIRDIRWNRFRNKERYPVNEQRVQALMDSFEATVGVWPVILASANDDGTAELVFGHHRLEAAERKYGPDYEIDLVIQPVSDEMRLKRMAHENSSEFGDSSALVDQETIRAVVEAAGAGLIKLPEIGPKTDPSSIRYAPRFSAGEEPQSPAIGVPYTAQTIGRFIGWLKRKRNPDGTLGSEFGEEAQEKVKWALGGLELIEQRLLTQANFEGLTTNGAQGLITETRKALKRREDEAKRHESAAAKAAAQGDQAGAQRSTAKAEAAREEGKAKATEVGEHVAEAIKTGRAGYKQAAATAREVDDTAKPQTRVPRNFSEFAMKVADDLAKLLDPQSDKRSQKLEVLAQYKDRVPPSRLEDLVLVLEDLSERAAGWAKRLTATETVIEPEPEAPPANQLSSPTVDA